MLSIAFVLWRLNDAGRLEKVERLWDPRLWEPSMKAGEAFVLPPKQLPTAKLFPAEV